MFEASASFADYVAMDAQKLAMLSDICANVASPGRGALDSGTPNENSKHCKEGRVLCKHELTLLLLAAAAGSWYPARVSPSATSTLPSASYRCRNPPGQMLRRSS